MASVDWRSEELGAGARRRQGVHTKGTDKKEYAGRGGGGGDRTNAHCSLICQDSLLAPSQASVLNPARHMSPDQREVIRAQARMWQQRWKRRRCERT